MKLTKNMIGALLLLSFDLFAADNASATVSFEVGTIREITVSGNPGSLMISTATAGSQPDSVNDSTTTYNITTNETSQVITGAIDVAMPTGLTLSVNLSAPTGGSSQGAVALTTTAQNLVTGISNVAESSLGITYTLAGTVSAAPAASTNRTLTLTLAP